MFRLIRQDLKQFAHGPNLRDKIKVIILTPGFAAVFLFRVEAFLYRKHLLMLSYLFYRLNLNLHGIDILPGCEIGPGLRIEHPVGIVIGANSTIGSNCTIMHGVTLGVKNVNRNTNTQECPQIGNDVFIGANSTILGKIAVGDNSVIGAHSLVLVDCPANSRFTGSSLSLPQSARQDFDE